MVSDRLIEMAKTIRNQEDIHINEDNHWQVGYGRDLDENPLTADETAALLKITSFNTTEAEQTFFDALLINDIDRVTQDLEKHVIGYAELSKDIKMVLFDIAFGESVQYLFNQEGLLHAIRNGDYFNAAIEILVSDMAYKAPKRAVLNARTLAMGKYQQVLKSLSDRSPSTYEYISRYT